MNEFEFRVTLKTNKHAAKEEFINAMKKMADRAEHDHAIQIDLEEIETDSVVSDPHFESGKNVRGP